MAAHKLDKIVIGLRLTAVTEPVPQEILRMWESFLLHPVTQPKRNTR